MRVYQVALSGPNLCGRGVRYRILSATETDDVGIEVARGCNQDTPMIEYRAKQVREGVTRMLVAVTKKTDIKDADELRKVPETDWIPLDPRKLEPGMVPGMSYDELFGARDDFVLGNIWRRNHEVDKNDLDAIVGKALEVSTD